MDELEQKKIDALAKSMAVRFGKDVPANPELLLRAFAEFYEQATGDPLEFLVKTSGTGEEHENF